MNKLQRVSGSVPRKPLNRKKIGDNKSSMKLSVKAKHSHKKTRNSVTGSAEIKINYERILPSSRQIKAFLQGIKYAIFKILKIILLIFKLSGL